MQRFAVGLCTALLLAAGAANAGGNAAAGQAVFNNHCAMCHTIAKGGANSMGPNLYNVVGRKAASQPDFYYSPALKTSGIVWTDANLRKWVQDPQKMVPGTRMYLAGIKRQQDIDNLIAYLKTKK